MLECAAHPNITLYAYSEVKEISGYIGNFSVVIEKKPRFVIEDKCTGCGACSSICPVIVPNEFNCGMDGRKAIYSLFAQAVPLKYTIDPDACIECGLCKKACEPKAIDYDQKPEYVTAKVGTIIVTTGFKPFDPTGQYGYGKYANVITQLELERLIAPNGPTYGELQRISDDKHPKNILMIQCVGSRNIQNNEFCSAGVCCLVALKNASLIKQHDPTANITIAYMDMRTPGKYYEEYYKRIRESGIKFIRGNFTNVKEDPETKNLHIRIEDTLMNKFRKYEFDLVVLSVAMEPSSGTKEISEILRLEKSPDGYIKEFHARLDPIGTKVPGIFVAGSAQGPMSVDHSVAMAKGAASAASIPIHQGTIEIELVRAVSDEEACTRCALCIETCPYGAISMKDDKIVVDEITCRGCGACCAVCKNNAMTLRSFRNSQLNPYIDALLSGQDTERKKSVKE